MRLQSSTLWVIFALSLNIVVAEAGECKPEGLRDILRDLLVRPRLVKTLRQLVLGDDFFRKEHDYYYLSEPHPRLMQSFEAPGTDLDLEVSLIQAWRSMFYYDTQLTLVSGETLRFNHYLSSPTTAEREMKRFRQFIKYFEEDEDVIINDLDGKRILKPELKDPSIEVVVNGEKKVIALKDIRKDTLRFIKREDAPPPDLLRLPISKMSQQAGLNRLQTTTKLRNIKSIFSDKKLKPIFNEKKEVDSVPCIMKNQNWDCNPGVYLQFYNDSKYWGSSQPDNDNIRIVFGTDILDQKKYHINRSTSSRGAFEDNSISPNSREAIARYLWFTKTEGASGHEEMVFKQPISIDFIQEIVVRTKKAKESVLAEIVASGNGDAEVWKNKIRIVPKSSAD